MVSLRLVLWLGYNYLTYALSGIAGVIAGLFVLHILILRFVPRLLGYTPYAIHQCVIDMLDLVSPQKMFLIFGFQFDRSYSRSQLEEYVVRLYKADPILQWNSVKLPLDLWYWRKCNFNAADLIEENLRITSMGDLERFSAELHQNGQFAPGMPYWRVYYLPNYEQGPYAMILFHHVYGDGESFYDVFKQCTDEYTPPKWTLTTHVDKWYTIGCSYITGILAFSRYFLHVVTLPKITKGIFTVKNPRKDYRQKIALAQIPYVDEMLTKTRKHKITINDLILAAFCTTYWRLGEKDSVWVNQMKNIRTWPPPYCLENYNGGFEKSFPTTDVNIDQLYKLSAQMTTLKASWVWFSQNYFFKLMYYMIPTQIFARLCFDAMHRTALPYLSNMRGPRELIYIDGSPILDIQCFGATLTTAFFVSSYTNNMTLCHTYGDSVIGEHERWVKIFQKTMRDYLDIL